MEWSLSWYLGPEILREDRQNGHFVSYFALLPLRLLEKLIDNSGSG
jgi:hypothetical protein